MAAAVVVVVYASGARLYAGALGGARGSAVLGGGRVHQWWVRVRMTMCID